MSETNSETSEEVEMSETSSEPCETLNSSNVVIQLKIGDRVSLNELYSSNNLKQKAKMVSTHFFQSTTLCIVLIFLLFYYVHSCHLSKFTNI